ncbi:MAG: hypothetical protein JXB88_23280 [Spirochaetales bacterium]|nr:hypothetical protein [Spirochaetales bacterium]
MPSGIIEIGFPPHFSSAYDNLCLWLLYTVIHLKDSKKKLYFSGSLVGAGAGIGIGYIWQFPDIVFIIKAKNRKLREKRTMRV